ncbi:MAG: hypothetical protein SPD93_09500 [Lachnospiraceae bacterium]|nr:hypothetical protein [Lachnospiraceae bacterium]
MRTVYLYKKCMDRTAKVWYYDRDYEKGIKHSGKCKQLKVELEGGFLCFKRN